MSIEIIIVLILLALASALFMLEWTSVDVVTLLLLIGTVLSGVLTPEEAFSGFANEIIVILCSIFVLSGALTRTGVMDGVARWVSRFSNKSELRVLLLLVLFSSLMSAFVSNTTTTALLIPAVLALCRRTGLSPSRLMMPIAFASMMGGTCTLIGTSTNMAASGLVSKLGLEPFSIFEFTLLGGLIATIGVLYLALIGRHLLPATPPESELDNYQLREYLAELEIREGSPLVGTTLDDLDLPSKGINVAQVIRGKTRRLARSNTRIRVGDVLVVTASPRDLLALSERGVHILAPTDIPPQDLEKSRFPVLEALILPGSGFLNKTLKSLDLRRRFRVSAMAVYRRAGALASRIRNIHLQVGDVLLLQGKTADIAPLLEEGELLLLSESEPVSLKPRRGSWAVGAMLMAVVLSGASLLPVSIAFLLSALGVVLAGCVDVEEIYELIEWRLIILIGGMTSFGLAMQKSGAALFLADTMAGSLEGVGLSLSLTAFGALTMLLTQPLSNAAAALVILPVALPSAVQLGIDPRVMAVTVTLSASLSLVAPLEPASLLVYGPGKYRFRDFFKVGFPLSALSLALLVWLVPIIWGAS